MELYIHIPFCKSKCQYCDFVSFPDCEDGHISNYITHLCREIRYAGKRFSDRQIDTIYIGGGTPSILNSENISAVFFALEGSFDLSNIKEFTIECNPESISEEKLILYKKHGVDRISMGIQSLNDENLKEIGRIHNSKTAKEKLDLLLKHFDNVSVDLIIGLPFDTEKNVKDEVEYLSKKVKHISMYELILEEGTKLFDRVKNHEVSLPNDDVTMDLFNAAKETARNNGFFRYEISNFSKPGFESKHNLGYWEREEYIGLGLNASSFIKENDNEIRYKNTSALFKYISLLDLFHEYFDVSRDELTILSKEDILNEKIMLGLRTSKGIKKEFLGNLIPSDLKKFFIENGEYVSLNDDGMAVMNSILIKLL